MKDGEPAQKQAAGSERVMILKKTVLTGADRIGLLDDMLRGKRLGLITNPTGVNKSLVSTADVLNERYTLAALFAPEHGVRGDAQAGDAVFSYVDERTGVSVYSMYGAAREAAQQEMHKLDAVVFDIQDVGARFYTYLYTMTQAMTVCKSAGIPFILLDRINPIGGKCEGTVLDRKFSSFVGKYPTPTRSGVTIGEFARYINASEGIGCDLTVLPCEGWNRSLYFDETDLLWIAPSPNMPSVDSALVYIGTCLFEGTNLSEGRGTTKPFETIGAPWLKPREVIRQVEQLDLKGFVLRETYFIPSFSKHAGELCAGIQVHVLDRDAFEPFALGVYLVDIIRRLHPEFAFLETNFIDKLLGTDAIRKPDFDPAAFLSECRKPLDEWRDAVKPYLLYM